MIDKADKETQKRLKDIEDRLKEVYAQSEKDITQAWNRYMLEQNAYVKDLQEAYATAKQYGTAEEAREIGKQLGQAKAERTLQNQYYKDMVAETTKKLATVNETALRYVNDQMPNIYSINYNDAAVDCDRLGFRFDLVDEGTVKKLVTDGDIKLPNKALNIPKDMRWNTKQLNSSVLQGIVNGESMDKIAKRILPIVNNNAAAAIRNARTMVNGAENLGRLDSIKEMTALGIVVEKVWMATHDERTRTSHAYLDGESVAADAAFPNGLLCPGDPDGPPGEVYNCRCKLIREVVGIRKADGRIVPVNISRYEPSYFEGGPEPTSGQSYKAFSTGEDANKYFGQRPERSLRRENREEYDRRLEDYRNSTYYKWSDSLTPEQVASIGAYSGDAYSGINGLLRHQMTEKMVDGWNATEQISIQDMIRNITDSIDAFELSDGIKVYRTCENDVLRNLKLEAGSVFHDDGFGSTSTLSKKVASGNIVMEINVPPGKGHGAWINPLSGAQDEEYEFLLQRGSDYKVRAISKRGEDTVVELDLVGHTVKDYSYATKEEVIKLWKEKGIYDENNAKRI